MRGRHSHHGKHHDQPRHRPFDYGELRLLLLAMIAERPRHGYELIKAINERMGGRYTPSPGVMYPTLAWLQDMGYALPDTDGPGRKSYRITAEGKAFLVANRRAADELLARSGPVELQAVPASVLRSLETLALALRRRCERGAISPESAARIAAGLDAVIAIIDS